MFAAAERLRSRILAHAGTLLQCSDSRRGALTIVAGAIKYRDGRSTELTVGDIARAIAPGGALFDGELRWNRRSHVDEARDVLTSGISMHVAKVRLDPRTGFFRVLDYLAADDAAGRALNRMIVDGQVVGGVADGIGGVMFSEIVYDEH